MEVSVQSDAPYYVQVTEILSILNQVAKKYKKGYCYPSQEHILRLLAQFYGVAICRRTLNRWLRILEDCQYIQRVRRIRKLDNGQLRFNSTLYKLQVKAYKRIGQIVRKLGGWKRQVSRGIVGAGLETKRDRGDDIESGKRLTKEEMLDLVRKYNRGQMP